MEYSLPSHPLFTNLNDDERQLLLNCTHIASIQANETFAHEYERGTTFFLILTGAVQVSKHSRRGVAHTLYALHSGEMAGEISLMEDLPRPTTLTATEPTSLLIFDVAIIKNHPGLNEKLALALSKRFSNRLRELKSMTVESMQHTLEENQKRIALGAFMVSAIYVTDIYTLSLVFINDFKKYFSTTTAITVTIIFSIVLVIAYLIKKFKFPLAMFGLTTQNWKKDAIEAIALSVVFIIAFTLIKWISISTVFKSMALPLFDPTSMLQIGAIFDPRVYFISMGLYIFFAPLQEFIVRGTLQGTFYQFLAGSEQQRKWTAIFVSNFLFAIVHLHASPLYPFLAFIPGIFWGWLYARQNSLVGVSISHIMIGVWVIFITGFTKGLF